MHNGKDSNPAINLKAMSSIFPTGNSQNNCLIGENIKNHKPKRSEHMKNIVNHHCSWSCYGRLIHNGKDWECSTNLKTRICTEPWDGVGFL
jgi:hypothetical protein